jgi:membrane protease YdiL (CAAX protease family)
MRLHPPVWSQSAFSSDLKSEGRGRSIHEPCGANTNTEPSKNERENMKKTPWRNPLLVSIFVIVLVWLQELIRNVFYVDTTLALSKSMPRFLFYAFVMGVVFVVAVTLLLRYSGEKYGDIGFRRKKWCGQIATGAAFGILIFILQTFILGPIIDGLIPKTAMAGVDKRQFFDKLIYLPILIVLTSFKGGFSEELWRIFVLTRFQKLWGKSGLISALVVGSALFGIGHLYQGVGSMITVAIVGFLYALVYLRKKSALEVVAAHAVDDIISVTLGFILYYGK